MYYDGTTAPPGYVGYGSPFTSNTATVGSVNGTAAGYKASVTQGSYAYGGGLNDTGTASLSIVGSPFGTNTASVGSVFGTATAPSFYAGDGTPFGTASGTVTQTTKAIGGGVSTAADVVTIGAVYGDGVSPYKGYVGYGSPFTSNSATVGSVNGTATGYTATVTQDSYAYGGGLNQTGTTSLSIVGSLFGSNTASVGSVFGTATAPLFYPGDGSPFTNALGTVTQTTKALGGGANTGAETVTIGAVYYDGTTAPPGYVGYGSPFTSNTATVGSVNGTAAGYKASVTQGSYAYGGGLNDTGTASLSIVGSPFGTNTASVGSVFGTATAPSFYAGDGTPFGTASGTVTQTTKAIGGGVSTAADVVTIGAVYGDGVSPYKGYVGYGSPFTSNSATVGSVNGTATGYTATVTQDSYAYGGGLNQTGTTSLSIVGSLFGSNMASVGSVFGTATAPLFYPGDGSPFTNALGTVTQTTKALGGGVNTPAPRR